MYEGNWDNDKVHGEGTCTYANGNRYTGNYVTTLFIANLFTISLIYLQVNGLRPRLTDGEH